MTIEIRTTDGGTVRVSPELLQAFKNNFRGAVVGPDDREYDDTRKIWNAMIDRHPALIMRCTGTADVMQAVRFARDHQCLVAVRGGGHNIAGLAICDHALLIDLSSMRSVRVDPVAGLVRVQAGALLGDVDHECQAFGLATPLGVNSTTGIAGLTLGGGFGWLSRKYGMTVDNLVAAEVITADGERDRQRQRESRPLLGASRGRR